MSVMAEKPMKDYSFIRGACYPGGWSGDTNIIKRDLGYARRLNLNSTRIWLSYRGYQANPQTYIEKLRTYIRISYKLGISTMPILWNGNNLDTAILEKSFRTTGDKYVKAIIDAVKDEPGLLMWDIMNEPCTNDYYRLAPAEKKDAREAKIVDFVRYYCTFVKKNDPVNAITVGHTYAKFIPQSADLVDVICFHEYKETRAIVEANYKMATEYATKYNKPLINSEMACIGRANPYDMAIEICEKNKAGWYVFELMIQGYWSDVHGLVYPDGTIRDPSVIAAVYGFYRKRDLKTSVKANPNKEGHADKALAQLENVLKDQTTLFRNRRSSTDEILEAAEYVANLLESSEMVPMYEPPTAKIETWRKQPAADRDADAIRDFAYQLGLTLKKYARIF